MAMHSLTDLAQATHKRRGRPRGSGFPEKLSVRLTSSQNTTERLHFFLDEVLIKESGFVLGDACDVVFDAEQQRGIIFKRDGGYTLYRSARPSVNGRIAIPFVADSGFPEFRSQTGLNVLKAGSGMICFEVPPKRKSVVIGAVLKELERMSGDNTTRKKP